MAMRQLVRPARAETELQLIEPGSADPASLRVSTGSESLARLAATCTTFEFHLQRIELESISGREIGPVGEDLEATVAEILRRGDVNAALAALDSVADLCLFHIALRDTASQRILYVNRYGIVDMRSVGAALDPAAMDAERRLLAAVTKALSFGAD